MPVTIYHNPKCSTSRKTLDLLRSKGAAPVIRDYLKEPLTETELDGLLKLLGMEPREAMRTKEDEYTKLRLADPKKTRKELIAAMVKHPRLIQRPIVVNGKKAALGRPKPEDALKVL